MKVLGPNFSPWSSCCFSAKHAALRYQDNVSDIWGKIYIRELLFQWVSTIQIQLSILV